MAAGGVNGYIAVLLGTPKEYCKDERELVELDLAVNHGRTNDLQCRVNADPLL